MRASRSKLGLAALLAFVASAPTLEAQEGGPSLVVLVVGDLPTDPAALFVLGLTAIGVVAVLWANRPGGKDGR